MRKVRAVPVATQQPARTECALLLQPSYICMQPPQGHVLRLAAAMRARHGMGPSTCVSLSTFWGSAASAARADAEPLGLASRQGLPICSRGCALASGIGRAREDCCAWPTAGSAAHALGCCSSAGSAVSAAASAGGSAADPDASSLHQQRLESAACMPAVSVPPGANTSPAQPRPGLANGRAGVQARPCAFQHQLWW